MKAMNLTDILAQQMDREKDIPMFRQVYEIIRKTILSGTIPAKAKLPATRLLSRELGISRNTLVMAYDHLQSEGYVVSQTGSGTFVSDTFPSLTQLHADATSTLTDEIAHSPLTLSTRGLNLVRNAQASSTQWGAFVAGIPDVTLFPHTTWMRMLRRRWRDPAPELLTYAHGAGYYPLREEVANYLRLARSVRAEPDQVVITNGIHQSIRLLANLLADGGDSAWIENPAYWGARTVLKAAGLRTIPVDVDDEGLTLDGSHMREPPRLIFTTPSHQYPLGVMMSLARRRTLLEYAHLHKSWIIEDDYDSEFRFDGQPVASLQGLDTHGRVIYLGTFSKTLFPGLRMGFMVLPKALSSHLALALSEMYREGRLIDQAVLADFMAEGHYTTHIRRMRLHYARRQSILRSAIHDVFGEDWPISTHEAGLHLVMHLPPGTDDVGIVLAAKSMDISLRPLSRYYADGNGPPGLLFGYASVPDTQIRPLFLQLVQVITPALEQAPCNRTQQEPDGSAGKLNTHAWSGA